MPQNPHVWYKHYPADWLLGTIGLTLEQQGMYLRLLDGVWREGSIPDDVRQMSDLCQTDVRVIRRLCPTLLREKFNLTSTGWQNNRLERERQVQVAQSNRLSRSGKAGAEKRWPGHSKKIQIQNKNKTVESLDGLSPDIIRLTKKFAVATFKRTTTQPEYCRADIADGVFVDQTHKTFIRHCIDADRIIRLDGCHIRTLERILDALSAGRLDTDPSGRFKWSEAVQSLSGLRKRNDDGVVRWKTLLGILGKNGNDPRTLEERTPAERFKIECNRVAADFRNARTSGPLAIAALEKIEAKFGGQFGVRKDEIGGDLKFFLPKKQPQPKSGGQRNG